jgi:phosphate transport system ATP-binding protein
MERTVIQFQNFGVSIRSKKILEGVSFPVYENKVTAVIGPSGCGKTTLLRSINRLNDEIPGIEYQGKLLFHNKNILNPDFDVTMLRTKIGMVFQKPNPFPGSIYHNVTYGPRLFGIKDRSILDEICELSLKKAGLWSEVKNKLNQDARGLSGGQQQRLCIARAIAMQPEVILLDEPTSALDPASTFRIEELIVELKEFYSVVLVTHNMHQAARISDYVAFLFAGEDLISHLIEFNKTSEIFVRPKEKLTENYLAGKIG